MNDKQYCVYILASKRNGTLYTGVTSNLLKRVYAHKSKQGKSFAAKHCTSQLVYYEIFEDPINAIYREKKLKKWRRSWKIALIEKRNKYWVDLYRELI